MSMQIRFRCPACESQNGTELRTDTDVIGCAVCGWTRTIPTEDQAAGPHPGCSVCGCQDLWRQKDFPQWLGLLMVGLGIILSTWAWAVHRPGLAIGVLMGFALIDLILFALMGDVLVCYQCGSRMRGLSTEREHPSFDHELAERYRQEQLRVRDAASSV